MIVGWAKQIVVYPKGGSQGLESDFDDYIKKALLGEQMAVAVTAIWSTISCMVMVNTWIYRTRSSNRCGSVTTSGCAGCIALGVVIFYYFLSLMGCWTLSLVPIYGHNAPIQERVAWLVVVRGGRRWLVVIQGGFEHSLEPTKSSTIGDSLMEDPPILKSVKALKTRR